MVSCRYGISLLVFNSTSHSFAALTRELSNQTLKKNSISTRARVLFSIYQIHYFKGRYQRRKSTEVIMITGKMRFC